jgi:AraC-like DNA-binding protein
VYVERPSRLPGAVVWSTRAGSTSAIVPDGCMDVICYGDRLLVAGPDTRPHTESPGELAAGTPVVGVRFAPGIGPTVLGVPAAELRDRRVWLDEVWGRGATSQWRRHVDRSARRGRALEELAGNRLAGEAVDRSITHVAYASARGSRVDEIARMIGWSERTLRRRCDEAFGYGPKVLGRILRFQRAAALVRSGVALADVAAACGYADQSHLSRETRRLTGAPLTALR